MNAEIEFSPSYSLLTVYLDEGEEVSAEPGAMVAQFGVKMHTTGIGQNPLRGFRRVLGGESFFVNRFVGGPGGGWVMLAPPAPGDVREYSMQPGDELFIQSGSYLASWGGVGIDSSFQGLRGMFIGEGLFFLRATAVNAPGSVFFDSYGAIREIPLEPGGELVVDTGHLVAFTSGVDYSIGRVGGIRSLVGGGEGLVMRLRGSGSVWVQTRHLLALTDWATSLLPQQGKGG